MPTTIVAVVLNWNQSRMTLDCLGSLRNSVRPCDHIVLVDNGSRPEERAFLRDGVASDIRLVQLSTNRGFAGGMNAGIVEAGRLNAEYVWLVNNDSFPDCDCLGLLTDALDGDSTLAAVAPRLVGVDGLEQHAGGQFNTKTGYSACFYSEEFPIGGEGDHWVVGTAPLFRNQILAQVGGFDERFFAYSEEIDMCLRIGRRGGRFAVVPAARTLHIGQASTGGGFSPFVLYLHTRNQYFLARRHLPAAQSRSYALGYLRRCLDHAGCFVANGMPDRGRAVVQAALAILAGETGPPGWFSRAPRVADFVARHPWQLVRSLGWLERQLATESK